MQGLRILVVEDDEQVAAALRAGLASLGHTLLPGGTDGLQAIELAARLQPELMVMDIRLPGMDGIQAAARILSLQSVPIVLVTGYLDDDLLERSREAGVMAYLLKPVDLRLLGAAIELAAARFDELQILRRENRELKDTLEARKLVERAKGILMERLHLSEARAFELMRERSRKRRVPLREVAAGILDAEELLRPGAPEAGPPAAGTPEERSFPAPWNRSDNP
jgi:response regulator NasT